tara:strand:+ start:61 stop:582 length:522 start_codon:yes stop_codon:yes gene_type:complete
MQYCLAEKPSYMSMTAFVNYSLEKYFLGLDACDTLKIPNEQTNKKQTSEVFSSNTRRVPNSINKEKKFLFKKDLIPFDLSNQTELIHDYWKVKQGQKTKEAFNRLIGQQGLAGIFSKYGKAAVEDQLRDAIANKWKSVSLKNYEAFGRPKQLDKDSPALGLAGRVYTAEKGFG